MIVITGAAGFIGSCLVSKLNNEGFNDLILVDDFSHHRKRANYTDKKYTALVERDEFLIWLEENQKMVQFIFHIGAKTDTTLMDISLLNRYNLHYTQALWNICIKHGLPLVYASSAATYGGGELGYDDNHSIIPQLKPLNPYGASKNYFDIWALQQPKQPYFWAGLKFFNVYGPNEYHKGRMASVIFHAYNQIKEHGYMKLFRSHNPDYEDGKQLRDFVYVKDVVDVCYFLLHLRKDNGIYNLGSGTARTFLDLATNTFEAMSLNPDIRFIDTPIDLRDKYQYYTQANMDKLKSIGYTQTFTSLEEGVHDYVGNYLMTKNYY